MSTRFILGNALASGVTILNSAAGGGIPPRVETAPYVMERALLGDRYSVWKFTMPGSGQIDIDLDTGAVSQLSGWGVLGTRALNGGAFYGFDVFSADNNVYYPSAPGWTARGSSDWSRDGACTTTPLSLRYWRVTLYGEVGKSYTVGRLMAGVTTDMGMRWSPGGGITHFQNRIEQELQDGSMVVNTLGDPGAEILMPVFAGTTQHRDLLRNVAAVPGSIVLIDDENNAYEVVVVGGRCEVSDVFIGNYNLNLRMRRLP